MRWQSFGSLLLGVGIIMRLGIAAASMDVKGQVTAVLDHQTLEITPANGAPLRVRLRLSVPWSTTREELAAAALHHTVTATEGTYGPDGTLSAVILLQYDIPLSNVLQAATWDSPMAKQYHQQRALAAQRAQAEAESRATSNKPGDKAPSSPPMPQAPRTAREEERQRVVQSRVAQIGQRSLPEDYRAQIDARFVHILKDPDSRRVEYVGQPYGSAVCGTVNARNAFGGYTGQQVFLTIFTETGVLKSLDVFDDKQISLLKYTGDIASNVLRHCGLNL